MSVRREIPGRITRAQGEASDPRASVWVSAHAGSGKTHVLTQRVVRLLLGGAPPSKILCLTYTKAAAANMSMRVFAMLSKWTVLDDAELAREIERVGAPVGAASLATARRLFARTVETPGGLKIQTIHAFCERLLHLFPFEANLPSRFRLVEEGEQREALASARRSALAEAIAEPDGAAGRALAILSAATSESGFQELLVEAIGARRKLHDFIRQAGTVGACRDFLGQRFGLGRGETPADIGRAMVDDGVPPTQWAALARRLAKGGTNDGKLGEACLRALAAAGDARLDAWLAVFFTQKGEPRGVGKIRIVSKALQDGDRDLLALMEGERDRLVLLRERRKAALIVERTAALVTIAELVLRRYQDFKNARALLDFDDLIDKTLALLSRSDAGWVLYKLDSGIDHVLVDEAQDTSPEQWEILRRLAEEFTAGETRGPAGRTFFAVGDEKQSIYSFQGAKPAKFAEMKRYFGRRVEESGALFRDVPLNLSFRSAPAVLSAVDRVFASESNREGLSSDPLAPLHEALKTDVPGLVEIWDPVAPGETSEPRDWKLPLDAGDPADPPVIVARRVAALARSWLRPESRERVFDEQTGAPRPVRAGDVIVLVRTRSAFFEAIIRALKDAGVPVAGADRLKFVEHIAVMDLMAAGRAALLPKDDLSLACLLKSPLFGLDDDDLVEIAPERAGSLIEALEASRNPAHRAACARLAVWRARARGLTPFMFYARLLGADGGRRRLLARLGPEAGDAIDEFLNQAMNQEQRRPPSLAAFLASLEVADGEVKRDMDSAGDYVRVMTVHAAKGLEAKIVILPDTCGTPDGKHDPKIFALEDAALGTALVWSPRKDDDFEPVAAAREASRRAARDEYRRLLYVAMTRAEERLYVMGYVGVRERKADCWYNMIRDSLADELVEAPAFWNREETVWRRAAGEVTAPAPRGAAGEPVESAAPELPAWLTAPARPERDAPPPVRPSTALAAADLADFRGDTAGPPDRAEAARAGRLVHALLQHLPEVAPEKRRAAALRFLSLRAGGLDEARRLDLAGKVLAIIEGPALASLFGPGSRAEASLAGRIETAPGRFTEIVGQVDRLAVTADEALVADFKTGRPRPASETPASYVAQLALYRAALAAIYPSSRIRALLVWVNGPEVVEFSEDALRRALASAGRLHDTETAAARGLDGSRGAT